MDRALAGPGGVPRLLLTVIVAAFLALSLAYSVINPIFEAPDELWHFLSVKFIRDNKALIVQSSDGLVNPARQEGGQPPLYYLLSAALMSSLPTGPTEDVAVLNFDGQPGRADSRFNKNVVVHSEAEDFPYRGVSLAVHLLRAFSILLSTGTVLTTYAIAREIFPGSTVIQLGAAAFNAFVPQFVFISASINNDNLVVLLSSLVILYLIKLAKGDASERNLLVLGLVTGLVGLTKVSSLGLLPLSFAVIVGVAFHHRRIGIALKGTLAVTSGFVWISGWWYVRNWLLYGDPLGLRVFLQTVDRAHLNAGPSLTLVDVGMLATSFFALFGWSNISADPFVYWFFVGLLAIGLVGLVYSGVFRERLRWGPAGLLMLIPVAWLAILAFELLFWAGTVGYDTGRLLFPSISGVSVLTVLGISKLCGWRLSSGVIGGAMAAMFVIAALMPIVYIRPAYKQGLQFVANQRAFARPLNATFGDRIELLGYEISRDAVAPGQKVSVMLYWKPLPGLDEGLYRVRLDLVSEDRHQGYNPISDMLAEPGIVRRLKKTGWLLRGRYELEVPADARLSSHLPIVVRVERPEIGFLEAYDGLMRPIGHDVVVAQVRVDDSVK